jgi:molybdate transport system regulatory protein
MSQYPRVSFRIEFGPGRRLGPGKVRLLELIAETGSIAAAARAMGMSYRRAWLLIEAANGLAGGPAVETAAGGSGGGGARLTPLGRELVARYRGIEAETERLVGERLRGLGAAG